MENMLNRWRHRTTVESAETGGDAGALAVSRCPFYSVEEDRCTVATGAAPLDQVKKLRCCSDEHDDCPSYLAYLLRRSKALRRDSDWLDAGQ